MALFKSKNKHSEMDEDKPQHKAMAVAYAMKRKGGAMAHGGKLCAHGAMMECPEGCHMAEGGMMPDMDGDEGNEMDMVGHIMKKRQQSFSEGGRVANDDTMEADLQPNQFDVLALEDDLEGHYTEGNSGDDLSSPGEDERRHDMVSQIISARKKKAGHNPRPA